MEEIFEMSEKEVYRCTILQQVVNQQLTQVKAAEILKITDRQVRNLLHKYKNEGPNGIISKKRGKVSNRAFEDSFKNQVLALVSDKYPDFGPTFAHEKLIENHNYNLSVETLRGWMLEHRLYSPRKSRKKVHQLRPRRENFGELIQIDASIHPWFEDRADKCALIVFIDDATSLITSLHFCKSECLEGYFKSLKEHLLMYGRPCSLYSDRHSIFAGPEGKNNSQFVRALKELDIESILARSPQAKGRVERANRTLQDRLIKEMRLKNISSIEEANRFLPEYVESHNNKFCKEPKGAMNTHRSLALGCDLERILSRREERTLSKDLSFSFYNKRYKIMETNMVNRLKGKKISVVQEESGSVRVYFMSKQLKVVPLEEVIEKRKVLDCKSKILWKPKSRPKKSDHPWKKYGYQIALSNKISKMEEKVV